MKQDNPIILILEDLDLIEETMGVSHMFESRYDLIKWIMDYVDEAYIKENYLFWTNNNKINHSRLLWPVKH